MFGHMKSPRLIKSSDRIIDLVSLLVKLTESKTTSKKRRAFIDEQITDLGSLLEKTGREARAITEHAEFASEGEFVAGVCETALAKVKLIMESRKRQSDV